MFSQKFEAYIKGAFPLIKIETNEYDRALLEIVNTLFSLSYLPDVYIYVAGKGMKRIKQTDYLNSWEGDFVRGTSTIEQALRFLLDSEESVLIVRNLDSYLQDVFRRPLFIDLLYSIYEIGISKRIFLIDLSMASVPIELKNYFITIDFPLPEEKDIQKIVSDFVKEYNVKLKKDELNTLSSLMKGMSKAEIEGALTVSLVIKKKIDLSLIREEKAKIVFKTGLLEWIEDVPSIDDIGGLEKLKEWFKKIAFVFYNYDQALKFGIKPPKGCLLTGIPGTGKTLSAKAIASLLNLPLFRLDISRLYGSLVGETEKNVREALRLIDALSPCVVLVDEIEKALSGIHSSSYSDSGVTSRLVGSILYYLQEKKTRSFFVCTANDISILPPELLRKGRFDEIWYVGLPTSSERKNIWEIHLSKTGRNPENYDIDKLVNATKFFTGAEIENVIQETLYFCFYEQREPTTEDFVYFSKQITPLAIMEKEKIAKLEEWAKSSKIKKANSSPVAHSKNKKIKNKRILN